MKKKHGFCKSWSTKFQVWQLPLTKHCKLRCLLKELSETKQKKKQNKNSCPSRNCSLIVERYKHKQKQAKQNLSSGSADQIRHHFYETLHCTSIESLGRKGIWPWNETLAFHIKEGLITTHQPSVSGSMYTLCNIISWKRPTTWTSPSKENSPPCTCM